MLRVIQWVDHLWHELILLGDLEHSTCVLVASTVVCSGEDCKELTAGEAFEAIHDALVRSQDISAAIGFEEVLNSVGAKLHDITSTVRISDEVWLDAKILVAISWV